MDDRVLFDRFHQALDVEPPADAYVRLRKALDQRSARPAQPLGWGLRWPRMGLRLAAVVTAAVIVIAAAAAFFSTHRVADRTSPADTSQAIMAYKLMVGTDHDKVQTAGQAEGCNNGSEFAACVAYFTLIMPAQNQFLADLNRFHTPSRFAAADSQLRRHITAQIARENAILAADRAQDAATADLWLKVQDGQTGRLWAQIMVASIVSSKQGTVDTYAASVRYNKQKLDSCTECNDLAGQSQFSCTGSGVQACLDLVHKVESQVTSLQTAVVAIAAPGLFVTRDRQLQLDLAKADSALTSMADALAAGDQAGFSAGRSLYQQAMIAIKQDAAAI
jgi:hypothetical protein